MPKKYNNGRFRWLISHHNRQDQERYILTQAITNGGIISDWQVGNPTAIPVIEVLCMPNNAMLLVPETL